MIKSYRLVIIGLLLTTSATSIFSQKIERIEPPSWFIGMKEPVVQLMVYGKDLGSFDVSTDYPGASVTTVIKTDNPNYLFVNLNISGSALPGTVTLTFTCVKTSLTHDFPLLEKPSGAIKGFDASDVIYLLMPDRFANGDPSNDNVEEMLEKADRSNPGGRHGGDLKGISDHLDYFKNLGVTGLWLNPFLENNQQHSSYHGYSTTDFYRTDPRFGSNEEFRQLVTKAHSMGLKVVMDMIFNHIGSGHWWMKDLPSKDWVHQFDKFTRTNYKASTYMDPYAAESDVRLMEQGWFDVTMPDLNQSNPLVETYLAQNSLWWIAYSGLDGIRMDTYPYSEPNMMSRWAKRVIDEFPGFFIVGEVWYDEPAHTSYWALNKKNSDGYRSNLPSLTDLPLCFATHTAFTGPASANDGMSKLYTLLSQDFLYPEPMRNVIFLDNHDMTRFYTETGKSLDVYKMALSFIMTTRGIPQFYYGTEIVMEGDKNRGDGFLRENFPGGWPGDAKNAFNGQNLSETEKEAFDFTKRVLDWRRDKEVIHHGKLKQFIPENGLYVYFRYNEKESVMIILNNSEKESRTITKERYREAMEGFTRGYDVITGENVDDLTSFSVTPKTAMIIELK
ncbi:MAG TPA: glycoside hydrolase family 13 protein [Bacteroidales bacterium]|nr:glycoside hydrolase family 13 protein [Bacteroidales bacterium]